jgi:hypothetical protein
MTTIGWTGFLATGVLEEVEAFSVRVRRPGEERSSRKGFLDITKAANRICAWIWEA